MRDGPRLRIYGSSKMSRGCRYAEGDVVAEFWYSPVVDTNGIEWMFA